MGLALAYLLANDKNYKQKTCVLDIGPKPKLKIFSNNFYVSTGFIQHKSYKLIKRFFYKPPIIDKVQTFSFIGPKKIVNIKTPNGIGYILNIEKFIQELYKNIASSTKINFIYNTYVTDIIKLNNPADNTINNNDPNAPVFKLTIKNTITQQESTIFTTNLIIADGTISNTSKLLYKKGFKVNINHKFSQGAEAIVQLPLKTIENRLKHKIYFGIAYEFAGYGYWIAPYSKNKVKIGYAIDQKVLLRRKYNTNKLLNLAIKRALQVLNIPKIQAKILHKGFKLIPLVTATQLYNITPYKHIWQIGDAGGFVGPLLLDGIFPGLNSTIDTYKELIKLDNINTDNTNTIILNKAQFSKQTNADTATSESSVLNPKKQTMLWQPKVSIPGNSIYTHKLLTYITTSAILKEIYNLIFIARPITKISALILEKTITPAFKLLMKIKKENI